MSDAPLLQVEDLQVTYRGRRGGFQAVQGVSFELAEGETLGLVGESGSGKSTIGRAILGLAPVTAGTIRFRGQDIGHAKLATRRALSKEMQVIFQDPYGSLNPTITIAQTLAEPIRIHERASRAEIALRLEEAARRIGFSVDALQRYPREFSGGQRQRIAIARALMMSPRLVICDEPVSALDLSIQAQILNLLTELQQQLKLSYLFISHDLAVVRHVSKRLIVLRHGEIVEHGTTAQIFDAPQHDYTRRLLASVPGEPLGAHAS